MAIVKRKTRKIIKKQVSKVIRKHGPEVATALASGLLSSLLTMVIDRSEPGETAKKKVKKGGALAGSVTRRFAHAVGQIPAVQEAVKLISAAVPSSSSGAKKKKRPAAGRRKSSSGEETPGE